MFFSFKSYYSIQPLFPQRLLCYNLTPVSKYNLVALTPSIISQSQSLMGNLYKIKVLFHRNIIIYDYL